ncbi:MAG: FkbM family methyltransferase [Burkholderiales bacterium]|nr:FkbM family methyltransferase [Burkholderiales bacterium]
MAEEHGPGAAPREVRMRSATLRVADDQPTFWDKVARGQWEPETLALLEHEIAPGTTFLDLGAWVGPTALYAAALGARVIALEADPVALHQLQRNLAANPALAARIEVLARAVHASEGPVAFGARRKPGDSMSSVLVAPGAVTWVARTITPAALAARIGAEARLFIKIDIEGGEYELLPAMGPLLARPNCRVLLSLHPGILATVIAHAPQRELATRGALAAFEDYAARQLAPEQWLFARD